MAQEIDLQPVSHITTDAIGPPGKRVFYIQGWQEQRTVTLIVEKIQIQSLAVGLEQFLAEIQQKFPDLVDSLGDYTEEQMRIQPPVDPLFRIGELGLGYDSEADMIVLVARELIVDDSVEIEGDFEIGDLGDISDFSDINAVADINAIEDISDSGAISDSEDIEDVEDAGRVVRFWCTRSQIRAMCHWGMEIASRGRPFCPQCGEPMDPQGHFCPKKNGHKH